MPAFTNQPAKVTIDTRPFDQALKSYLATTQRSLAEVMNQRAYNVAGRTAGYLPPFAGVEAEKARIQHYLTAQLGPSRKKTVTKGRRAGQSVASGRQLERRHLIIQKIQKRLGRKGLWGGGSARTGKASGSGKMLQYAGEMLRRAKVGAGHLRAIWLPIIRGLFPHIRYRRIDGPNPHPFRGIAQWPGSAASSTVQPAKPAFNPFAELIARITTHGPRVLVPSQDAKVMRLETAALQRAFDDEGKQLVEHVARKLQEEANKVNARG